MIWDMNETAITIIAASIPVLRVLVKDIRTTMRNYRNTGGDATQKGGNTHIRTNIGARHTRNGSAGGDAESGYREDSRSDKSILKATVRDLAGEEGIVRTQAVSVQYGPRKDTDVFEMGRIPQ